ncbi:MAG: hypothetical protein ACFFCQ_04715, partial [Promethearchaeota archaeon]
HPGDYILRLEKTERPSQNDGDKDKDNLTNLYEFLNYLNVSNEDTDGDNMPDGWEVDMGLNPFVDDAIEDLDEDGLLNLQEWRAQSWANQTDTDNDGIPDEYEWQNLLNITQDDSNEDRDNDGMPNLWEYQMGLFAVVNDALEDLDEDKLTNLHEFQLGSWANQSDTDLDGLPDAWEYAHGFNMNDPSTAAKDHDGDGVSNIEEYKRGSNPNDFWSVPVSSFSILHISFIILVLLLSAFSGTIVFIWKTRQKDRLITHLNAPDYPAALKTKRAGFNDYFAFIQMENDAKELIEKGDAAFFQGDLSNAAQYYEQALTMYQLLGNRRLTAETVFRSVRVQKELLGSIPSVTLSRFPPPPHKDLLIEALDYMIKALVEEINENWGAANEAWQVALSYETLDDQYRMICQDALLETDVRRWLVNPLDISKEKLLARLDVWQQTCETEKHYRSLCEVQLLRVRVALATFQFDEVEKWLERCKRTAVEANLKKYQETAQKETEVFEQHKKRILALLEKETLHSPEEQAKKLQAYITKALRSLEKAGFRE